MNGCTHSRAKFQTIKLCASAVHKHVKQLRLFLIDSLHTYTAFLWRFRTASFGNKASGNFLASHLRHDAISFTIFGSCVCIVIKLARYITLDNLHPIHPYSLPCLPIRFCAKIDLCKVKTLQPHTQASNPFSLHTIYK